MADLPFDLDPALAARLELHLDAEGKVARVVDDLGQLAGHDVALVDGSPLRRRQLEERSARVVTVPFGERIDLPDAAVDAIVSWWSPLRAIEPAERAEAERVLRPGGRIVVVLEYGRDDVSRLRPPDLPEYGAWSRRDGPYLAEGWKIRVVHAWWTFDSIDEAAELLREAFGASGEAVAGAMKRPRLSWNVAVYHRWKQAAP